MSEPTIKERFLQLTLDGSKRLLDKQESLEWLSYYALVVENPNYLRRETHEAIGVDFIQWFDFCMTNIEPIARLRELAKSRGDFVLGMQ